VAAWREFNASSERKGGAGGQIQFGHFGAVVAGWRGSEREPAINRRFGLGQSEQTGQKERRACCWPPTKGEQTVAGGGECARARECFCVHGESRRRLARLHLQRWRRRPKTAEAPTWPREPNPPPPSPPSRATEQACQFASPREIVSTFATRDWLSLRTGEFSRRLAL